MSQYHRAAPLVSHIYSSEYHSGLDVEAEAFLKTVVPSYSLGRIAKLEVTLIIMQITYKRRIMRGRVGRGFLDTPKVVLI